MRCAVFTRRQFVKSGACTVAASRLLAQQEVGGARVSVTTLEHDHILNTAKDALKAPVETLPGSPSELKLPPQSFYSNPIDETLTTKPFRAHAEALRNFSNTACALIAAFVLTREDRYAMQAARHLRAWFVAADTRIAAQFPYAGCLANTTTPTRNNVDDLVPLAELIHATSFLADSNALVPDERLVLNTWFAALLTWLDTDHQCQLARDTKDHRASSWLLLASAAARATRNDTLLDGCRLRFRKPTLRNQISPDGHFPQEAATPDPLRNTLFNFDLLAGCAQLLSSPFDDLWHFELLEGTGLRSVAAYLYPLIAHPENWPFIADAHLFREVPLRRPALLFAGRAYERAEYVELYRSLPDQPPPAALAYSLPIRQPLLWIDRPPHGL